MKMMTMAAGVAMAALMAGAVFAQPPGGGAPGGRPGGPPGGAPPPQPMQIKPVKPGVYMVTGDGGNSTVVVGPTGVVLVDTKNPGEKIYDELLEKIGSVTKEPIAEVLVTHHHADHSGNTLLFLNHGIPVIGQQQELEALQTYKPAGNPNPLPTAPSITYNDELTTTAGGVKVEAHHWGAGHTAGDTVVYFPQQKVVAGGDEVVEVTPNIDYPFGGSVDGWLKSLDALSKLDFDYVIPGHGNDPMTKAQFLDYVKKWHTFADRARAAVKAGTPKDKLMASIKTDDLGWNVNTPLFTQPARLDPFYAEMSK